MGAGTGGGGGGGPLVAGICAGIHAGSGGFVLLVSLPPILLVLLPLLVIIAFVVFVVFVVFVIVIVVLGLIVQSALALSEGYGGASGSCS